VSYEIREFLETCGVEGIEETSEGFTACCPFHEDSRPSFNINAESGLWKCHGCGESGSFPWLVSKLLKIPLAEAKTRYLRFLGWPSLKERKDFESEENPPLDERMLIPYLALCPRYMLDRGFTKKFLRENEIGYDDGDMRVVIPVRDADGKLIGITRRATLSTQSPKYLHSEFKKSRVLYGGVKLDGLRGRLVVVTEGQLDALMLKSLAGRSALKLKGNASKQYWSTEGWRVVATLGASMSEYQMRMLAYSEAAIALAYDNDEAGERGLAAATEGLLEKGVRELYRVRFKTKDPGELSPGDVIKLEPI